MALSNYVSGVIAILVVVILGATIIIPFIGDAQDSFSTTVENENYDVSYTTEAAPTVTITADTSKITIGDYNLNISRQTVLALCDEYLVFGFNNSTLFVMSPNITGYESTSEIVISNGTATYTTSGVEKSIPAASKVMYPSLTKIDHVGYSGANTSTFHSTLTDKIYSFGNPNLTNAQLDPTSFGGISLYVDGVLKLCNVSFVSGELEYTAEEIGTFNKKLSTAVSVSVTDSVGEYTNTNTSIATIVPLKYQDRTATDDMYAVMLGIIPMLIIIIPILLAVGLFGVNRRD